MKSFETVDEADQRTKTESPTTICGGKKARNHTGSSYLCNKKKLEEEVIYGYIEQIPYTA